VTFGEEVVRRGVTAGAIAAALLGSPLAAMGAHAPAVSANGAPITSPGHGRFVPKVGDWEGTVGGYPASFELAFEPSYLAFGLPPYGYQNLTTVVPDSCPTAPDRYSVGVIGEHDVTPLGVGGSFPLARDGITGAISGPSSAALSRRFDTSGGSAKPGCRGALTWAMHPAVRQPVDDGAWALRFAGGETQAFSVSGGGRLALGIVFPASLGRCGGPQGDVNLFIGPGGAASVKRPHGALALRLGFTGATTATGQVTARTERCGAFHLAMAASVTTSASS
jgi:hypothetical protein